VSYGVMDDYREAVDDLKTAQARERKLRDALRAMLEATRGMNQLGRIEEARAQATAALALL
jgi:hypothetical protein